MKLYEKITYLRKRKGMSQEQFANEVEVSRQTIYKWETGATMPEIEKLKKIAEIFGMSYDELLNEDLELTEQPVHAIETSQNSGAINGASMFTSKTNNKSLLSIVVIACVFLLIVGIIISMIVLHKETEEIEYAYKITYQNIKDAYNPNALGYSENDEAIVLSSISATGYVFDGWYIDEERVTTIDPSTKNDIVLTAKWTPYEYSITYSNLKGEMSLSTQYYTVESNDISLPVLEFDSYEFLGWYNGDNKITKIKKGSIGNFNLVAKWEAKEYQIIYKGIEDASNSNPTKYYINSNTIKLQPPTKVGYTFMGWFSDESYQNRITEIKKGSKGDIILNAKWIQGEYSVIYSVDDLKSISMSKNYILANDLDLQGKEWKPLGTSSSPYKGEFNGNGQVISNFKITEASENIGLFGCSKGIIKNLGIENFTISVNGEIDIAVGGIVGYDYKGKVLNCYSNGSITVSSVKTTAGLLVGNSMFSVIFNCYSAGSVNITSSTYNNVGGLVGWCGEPSMMQCYSTADVYVVANSTTEERAAVTAGGLIGGASGNAYLDNPGGIIKDCYATGNVTAIAKATIASTSVDAGGFIGGGGGTITNCYAIGNVSADTMETKSIGTDRIYASIDAGGFAGGADKLVNCFATGDVIARSAGWALVAGLVNDGFYEGETENCYRISSQKVEYTANDFGNVKTHGTAIVLEEVLTEYLYTEVLAWSTDVWNIVNGEYPTLNAE